MQFYATVFVRVTVVLKIRKVDEKFQGGLLAYTKTKTVFFPAVFK